MKNYPASKELNYNTSNTYCFACTSSCNEIKNIATEVHTKIKYGKCSKISTTFFFPFSNKMLVFRAGIQKTLSE